MNNGQKLMSPQSAGGFLRRAAPEPNKRALYVGGLDPRVTEDMLKQIFEAGGTHVLSVKIIPDKNVCICAIFFFLETSWLMVKMSTSALRLGCLWDTRANVPTLQGTVPFKGPKLWLCRL
jgi:hypothetical protein